jgi:hypothetical protein
MHSRQIKLTSTKNQLRAAINANLASIKSAKPAKPVVDSAIKEEKDAKRQAFQDRKALKKLIRRSKTVSSDEIGSTSYATKYKIVNPNIDKAFYATIVRNLSTPKQSRSYKTMRAPVEECTASRAVQKDLLWDFSSAPYLEEEAEDWINEYIDNLKSFNMWEELMELKAFAKTFNPLTSKVSFSDYMEHNFSAHYNKVHMEHGCEECDND